MFALSFVFLTIANLCFVVLATVCHSIFMLGALMMVLLQHSTYSVCLEGWIVAIFLYFQRMDLGECPKIHDLALRADFEKASHAKDYYYDIDVSIHIVLMCIYS